MPTGVRVPGSPGIRFMSSGAAPQNTRLGGRKRTARVDKTQPGVDTCRPAALQEIEDALAGRCRFGVPLTDRCGGIHNHAIHLSRGAAHQAFGQVFRSLVVPRHVLETRWRLLGNRIAGARERWCPRNWCRRTARPQLGLQLAACCSFPLRSRSTCAPDQSSRACNWRRRGTLWNIPGWPGAVTDDPRDSRSISLFRGPQGL